ERGLEETIALDGVDAVILRVADDVGRAELPRLEGGRDGEDVGEAAPGEGVALARPELVDPLVVLRGEGPRDGLETHLRRRAGHERAGERDGEAGEKGVTPPAARVHSSPMKSRRVKMATKGSPASRMASAPP